MIDLCEVNSVSGSPTDPLCIIVVCPERTWQFRADDEEAREHWLNTLLAVKAKSNPSGMGSGSMSGGMAASSAAVRHQIRAMEEADVSDFKPTS